MGQISELPETATRVHPALFSTFEHQGRQSMPHHINVESGYKILLTKEKTDGIEAHRPGTNTSVTLAR